MSIKYAIFHVAVHFLIIVAIYFIFRLELSHFLIVLFATGIVDLDHVHLLWKHGVRGYFHLRAVKEFGKPRKYHFHNFFAIVVFSLASLAIISNEFFIIGLMCLSIVLHLYWDFFEDVFIFNMGIRHWKI